MKVKEYVNLFLKNKIWVLLLFVLQFVYLIVLSGFNMVYVVELSQDVIALSNDFKEIDISEVDVQLGSYDIPDISGLITTYERIQATARKLFFSNIISIFIFECFIWGISLWIINKKDFLKSIFRFSALYVLFLSPLYFIVYNLFGGYFSSYDIVSGSKIQTEFMVVGALFFVFHYFLFVVLCFCDRKFKESFKIGFKVAIKKVHFVLPFLILCGAIVYGLGRLLYFVTFAQTNLFLLFVCICLFVFSFVFVRLLFVKFVRRISRLMVEKVEGIEKVELVE